MKRGSFDLKKVKHISGQESRSRNVILSVWNSQKDALLLIITIFIDSTRLFKKKVCSPQRDFFHFFCLLPFFLRDMKTNCLIFFSLKIHLTYIRRIVITVKFVYKLSFFHMKKKLASALLLSLWHFWQVCFMHFWSKIKKSFTFTFDIGYVSLDSNPTRHSRMLILISNPYRHSTHCRAYTRWKF
jgi:hypothetical protein